jgi:hypothetical protein
VSLAIHHFHCKLEAVAKSKGMIETENQSCHYTLLT